MKYLLFILLMIVILITAGCIGGNKNTVVTSQQTTPTLTVPGVEMIERSMSYKSYGDATCNGVLKSSVNEPVTAWVSMAVYDNNNVKLGEGYDIVNLDPFGKSTFEAAAFNSDKYSSKIDTYRCYIDHAYGSENKNIVVIPYQTTTPIPCKEFIEGKYVTQNVFEGKPYATFETFGVGKAILTVGNSEYNVTYDPMLPETCLYNWRGVSGRFEVSGNLKVIGTNPDKIMVNEFEMTRV